MARAIWKARIVMGSTAVPVKLYSVAPSTDSGFRLLHAKDHVPVEQRMVEPESGEVVPADDVRKGYETDEGDVVVLTAEELREIQPEASRDIEVLRFVDAAAVADHWMVRPYLLGPDGRDGAYAALVEALERSERYGIARWVMRSKDYAGVLRPVAGRLVLTTMRWATEVVAREALPRPPGADPSKKEVALARQLVGMLQEDEPDLSRFENEHRARLQELVEAKQRGETIEPKPGRREAAPALLDALRKSVEAGRGRKERRAG